MCPSRMVFLAGKPDFLQGELKVPRRTSVKQRNLFKTWAPEWHSVTASVLIKASVLCRSRGSRGAPDGHRPLQGRARPWEKQAGG